MGYDKSVVKLTQGDADFYNLLGPFFGSREIQRETNDRFYDDSGKIWYVIPSLGAVSVKSGAIKNVWAKDHDSFCKILDAIIYDYPKIHGISPAKYALYFQQKGFSIDDVSKNFINVVRAEQ